MLSTQGGRKPSVGPDGYPSQSTGVDAYYRLPVWVTALFGFILQGLGVYWDIAWHIEVGRDKLFSAPHNAILSGMALVGTSSILAIAYGGKDTAITKAASLSLGGVAIQLVGLAVIDDWWHRIYGIDATLWSPPHLLTLFAGYLALFGFLLGLSYGRSSVSRTKSDVFLVTGLANLLVLANILLAEYDFAFPQYRLAYQPVVLAASTLFCLMAAKQVLASRYAATTVAALFTVIRLAMWPVLGALDRVSRPFVPAAVLAGLVIDLTVRDRQGAARPSRIAKKSALIASAIAVPVLLAAAPVVGQALSAVFELPPPTPAPGALVLGGPPALAAGIVAGLAGRRVGILVVSVSVSAENAPVDS